VRTVLAVVDSSPASLIALAAAASLAQPIGARVVVLHTGPRAAESLRPAAPGSGRQWADIAAKRLQAMGIAATGHATLGTVTDAIESIAVSENVDVVIVATRPEAVRPGLGEVAEQLLRTRTRPVLLVRSDARVGSHRTRANTHP
jgi:nucleotide-binding universal stress UspA family protein